MAVTPRKKRTPPPANETKAQRFIRVGKTRLGRVISDLKLVGQLAQPANYDYTTEQVELIRKQAQKALDAAVHRLNNPTATKEASSVEL